MEGVGNLREVMDESSVEVHEPYEGLDILDLCWLRPVCGSLDFNRVRCYMVLRDTKAKVVLLSVFTLAFLQSEESLVGMQRLEYLPGDCPMDVKGGWFNEHD